MQEAQLDLYDPPTESIQTALSFVAQAAQKEGINITAAILNASGILVGLLRMPNSFLASTDYAQWKAWTAVSFDMPSHEFSALREQTNPQIYHDLISHPKVTALPGGFPIYHNARLIGGIGVSGGNADQDQAIAKAGRKGFLSALTLTNNS